ncbi:MULTISPECIES: accessory Sec system translocase SecA2 [unclassified Brevibacterium]|uniref:accessory Sec system translocase SecA2 n=1 Tax=unclassified Brevibacterium TaxID=2614124 RepID=UPI001E58DBA3|nr:MULTISPECIES: accessory Sec system translocase SecA2 [unclassified Brevibacterium]MCD1284855.1 accessory Sec system translocase SecA2 [Brevibacterium sp. CCUG 69071]MDK8435524.1 accessory Sec system translocase SecA2 [Brevibacterium sp. H-BE7]
MGFFSRLLNRPGAQADKATGWFDRAADELDKASREFSELSDAELTEAAGEVFAKGTQQDTLIRYCALAREAAERALDERAYDTQLKGLVGLLQGTIIQMATGEGKTLVGALAAAGYALQGRRVHVVSVNDYLAVRDRTWMKPVFDLLGVDSGAISAAQEDAERRDAYRSEVLYASVTEVGFDVLRDRFITDDADLRVPSRDVVIVDEADSVLIDEARVPLVLAGSASVEDSDAVIAALVEKLSAGVDYEVSPDHRAVSLTDEGVDRVESELEVDLFGEGASELAAVNLALYAKALVKRDVDYLVVDGRIKLISASRGRVAELQRWPDGLQAAVEAKEGVGTTESGEILDQMTVEELVHGYETVCGMTGTALAVGDDLREFYDLEIVPVDTHLPVIRKDEPDRLYTYQESKERAIVEEIAENHGKDRPVLIGTSSVAESESLASRLAERGIKANVLNAKDDSLEAEIIAAAGAPGAVTVSTQMAGRGTDIRLSDDAVAEAGGLLVIGAGRYLSSRLDDQLRGRAGRQGDPGTSVFFTSLEDELLTRVPEIQRFVSEGDETGWIESKRALGLVEHAQRIAEGQNTALHRDTWKFNELMAKQRDLVLERRVEIRTASEPIDELKKRLGDRAGELADQHSEELVDSVLREVMLFHLDSRWVDHLAFLNDLREGIHLRTFAREKPHEAFNTESIRVFSSFWSDVVEDSATTVEEAEFTDEGIDLASHGLKRPSSTWTYLTTESAFGSDVENIVKRIKR